MHAGPQLKAVAFVAIGVLLVAVALWVLRQRAVRKAEFAELGFVPQPVTASPVGSWVTPPFTPRPRRRNFVQEVRRSDVLDPPVTYAGMVLQDWPGGESAGDSFELLMVRLEPPVGSRVGAFLLASHKRPPLPRTLWPTFRDTAIPQRGSDDYVLLGSPTARAAAEAPPVRSALRDMADAGVGVTVLTASDVPDGSGVVDLVAVLDGFSGSRQVVSLTARLLRSLAVSLND